MSYADERFIQNCRDIADRLGVKLRIRSFIDS